jgi:hypothetical protein
MWVYLCNFKDPGEGGGGHLPPQKHILNLWKRRFFLEWHHLHTCMYCPRICVTVRVENLICIVLGVRAHQFQVANELETQN